jgi:hypothetical protein
MRIALDHGRFRDFLLANPLPRPDRGSVATPLS